MYPLSQHKATGMHFDNPNQVCYDLTKVYKKTGDGFTAYNFFSYTIGLLLIGFATLAFKIIFRTPWRDPATADLVTGHRQLTNKEIQELRAYYERPAWRRLGTYLRLW